MDIKELQKHLEKWQNLIVTRSDNTLSIYTADNKYSVVNLTLRYAEGEHCHEDLKGRLCLTFDWFDKKHLSGADYMKAIYDGILDEVDEFIKRYLPNAIKQRWEQLDLFALSW